MKSPFSSETQQRRVAEYEAKCAAGNDPSVGPRIDSVRGKIESGGFVVLEGDCFGTRGDVEINGLPQGTLKLQAQSWQHDAVTAAIPAIAGAYPQKVNIELDRQSVGVSFDVSNVATADFWPALEERTVAANGISNSGCPYHDQCSNGRAHHIVYTPDVGTLPCIPETAPNSTFTECAISYSQGDDVWNVALPGGWTIESVGVATSWGAATVGPSSGGSFTIHWRDANCEVADCVNTGLLSSHRDDHAYAADYALSVTLADPVETW